MKGQERSARSSSQVISVIWIILKGAASNLIGILFLIKLSHVLEEEKEQQQQQQPSSNMPPRIDLKLPTANDRVPPGEEHLSLAARRSMAKRQQLYEHRLRLAGGNGPQPAHRPMRFQPDRWRLAKHTMITCFFNAGMFFGITFFFDLLKSYPPSWAIALPGPYFSDSSARDQVLAAVQGLSNAVITATVVLPLFFLIKCYNSMDFQEVADMAALLNEGSEPLPPARWTMLQTAAQAIYVLILEMLFLVQTWAVSYFPIPFVASVLHFFHLSCLYSLYCFEYKWSKVQVSVSAQIRRIENNWLFFAAFGAPLAALILAFESVWSYHAWSSTVFAFCFPLLLISASRTDYLLNPFHCPIHMFKPATMATDVIVKVLARVMKYFCRKIRRVQVVEQDPESI